MAIGYFERRKRRRAIEEGLRRQLRADIARLLREQPDLLAAASGRREVTVGAGHVRVAGTAGSGLTGADYGAGEDGSGRVARTQASASGSAADGAARALAAAADAARARAGTVLGLAGELLVLWNAPFDQRDHHVRACRHALQAVEAARDAAGGAVELTCGVATGTVSLAVAGEGADTGFVAVGPPLDLASELARFAAAVGVAVVATEETVTAARGGVLAREIDMVAVEIERNRLRVFEVLGDPSEFETYAPRFEHYGAGLAAYRARNWAEARRCFERALEACPDDGPAAVMIARCKRLESDPPPPEWTPVTVLRDLR